jgi:hypothetical protein
MSDEIKPDVQVRADGPTRSLGNQAKEAAMGEGVASRRQRVSIVITLCLAAVVFCVMFFSRKPSSVGREGRGLPAPGLNRQDSEINPKLLTEKDLTNLIRKPRLESSLFGKIKVVSLRGVSEMPIGSEMTAVLSSGATDGIVKAQLTAPLIVDGEQVLPEKAVLFGKGRSGEERLFIEFSKVILPNAESYPIRAQAFDVSDKILGLKGALVGTRTKKMAGAIGFGFMGGMADGLQDTSGSIFYGKKPTARDAALAGASKAALDQSQVYIDEMKKSPNIIEVKAGTQIVVITDEPKPKERNYDEK